MVRVSLALRTLMIVYFLAGLSNVFSQDQPLQAAFTASVTEGEAPLTVVFDASPTVRTDSTKYGWYLGGAYEAEGSVVERTFTEPGEYSVKLTAMDGNERSNASQIITITGTEPARILQVPYQIEDDLIYTIGPNALVTGNGIAYTDSSSTVPVYNHTQNLSTYVVLYDEEDRVIASDWIIPSHKTAITFGIETSTLAEILWSDVIQSWPRKHFYNLYDRFAEHPRFDEAVELVRQNGNLEFAEDEDYREAYGLFDLIATETARAYALEQGWVDLESGVLTLPRDLQ